MDGVTKFPPRRVGRISKKFLNQELKLPVNPKNDIIICADQPLHFLGRVITQKYITVGRHTARQVIAKTTLKNVASYKSLKLAKWSKRHLDYLVLDEVLAEIQ